MLAAGQGPVLIGMDSHQQSHAGCGPDGGLNRCGVKVWNLGFCSLPRRFPQHPPPGSGRKVDVSPATTHRKTTASKGCSAPPAPKLSREFWQPGIEAVSREPGATATNDRGERGLPLRPGPPNARLAGLNYSTALLESVAGIRLQLQNRSLISAGDRPPPVAVEVVPGPGRRPPRCCNASPIGLPHHCGLRQHPPGAITPGLCCVRAQDGLCL